MLKIRRSHDRLIFNMGIPCLGNIVFMLRRGSRHEPGGRKSIWRITWNISALLTFCVVNPPFNAFLWLAWEAVEQTVDRNLEPNWWWVHRRQIVNIKILTWILPISFITILHYNYWWWYTHILGLGLTQFRISPAAGHHIHYAEYLHVNGILSKLT